ncbi:glycosyltransferase family 1 protein [Salinibacterium sp. TMP30]|uniref:glycosyltransferase family 4 protein n=1 Tax=Salinibacterium sp. TMP30 TaxID=3138237 RepID=UPI003139E846
MRVLFDGFWWARGPASNRQVLREFIWAWEREFPQDELTVAVRRASADIARSELPDRVTVVGTRLKPHGISTIVELPFIARRMHADVTITHNFTPAFGACAVFIHDYMFLTSPEWFTLKERAYFSLMPLTARRATWVFTSSQTEADRISRLSRGRTVVPVGLAVGRGLADAVPRKPAGLEAPDATGGAFLLCVGRLNARKNLATTIEAALASGRATEDSPLVIVGEPQGRSADLPAAVAKAVDRGIVRFLGFIDDDELAWLYENTSLLLFLTRDEGFGLPVLEARHFGAPVVVSDIRVFHEILGAKARFADPDDVSAIADAIRTAPTRESTPSPGDLGYSWEASVRSMREAISRQHS